MTNTPSDIFTTRREDFPVEKIERMVHDFYGKIRDDDVLGPIFDSRIEDWPIHLARMVSFWRGVLRSEPTFVPSERGAPPSLHRGIEELERAHFARWLSLFGEVADATYDVHAATVVKGAAARIASALSRHLPESAES
jgi:hemoglobin